MPGHASEGHQLSGFLPVPAGTIPCPHQIGMVETQFGPVEVALTGHGPAVLALHGGMGGYDMALILALGAFPTGYEIIAPSRPGFLRTPMGNLESAQAQADLFAALLTRLGRQQAIVLAPSASAPVGLAFAARHPERCAALIMMSPCTKRLHVPWHVRARLPFMQALARLPGVAAGLEWLTVNRAEWCARGLISDPELRARALAHPEAGPLMRSQLAILFKRLAERLPGTFNELVQLTTLPELPENAVRVPVLVIHGTADTMVPFDHATHIAAAIPGARLITIEGGEHSCLFTHIEQMRAGVSGFLTPLARTPAPA